MSIGVFVLRCPRCGDELGLHGSGGALCTACSTAYLNRFGHLIPLEESDNPLEESDNDAAEEGRGRR